MEGYTRVAYVVDVPEGESISVRAEDHVIALAKIKDKIYAFSDACPHAGAPLSGGPVRGHIITCTFHGWCFDVRTGDPVFPSKIGIEVYPSIIYKDGVYVKVPDGVKDIL